MFNSCSQSTIGWVNEELHTLMKMEDEDLNKEDDVSIYDAVQHTAEFLDMLVVNEVKH